LADSKPRYNVSHNVLANQGSAIHIVTTSIYNTAISACSAIEQKTQ